jgi:RNA polymerase sigma-70 factor, ECF subfamily
LAGPSPRILQLVPPQEDGELAARPDDELMRLVRMEHPKAFGVLVRRHSHWLVQLVAKLTVDPAFAEETAQDIWLTVWRGRTNYESGDFRVYLIAAARNRCRNRSRGLVRRSVAYEAIGHESQPARPDQLDVLLEQERRLELLNALGTLRPEEREALVLRYAEDLDYETIERVTAVKRGTLRAHVHRALVALRTRLSRAKGASR